MRHMYNFSKGTLTVANVMRELKDVVDWYSLGLALKLPKEMVEKQDFDEGGSNMIHQWLKMKGATWQSLAAALANVGEEESAEKVNNYCKVSCKFYIVNCIVKVLNICNRSKCVFYLSAGVWHHINLIPSLRDSILRNKENTAVVSE